MNGDTALHRAAGRGADSIVAYLVERGVRLDTQDRRGRTALDVALGVGGGGRGGPPPVRKSTAELLRRLMQEQGLTVPAAPAGSIASQRP
jgi:ankyrin repeat protein